MTTTEIDKELVTALNAAKSKEHHFAVVAKGPAVVHLIVSKTPIKNPEILKAKSEHNGTAIVQGMCQGKEGEMIFRVAKDPMVEDKKLKEFIVAATKLTIKPRFEIVAKLPAPETETSETSSEDESSGESPHTTAEEFTNRLKAIKAGIEKVRDGNTSVTADVKTLFVEIVGLAGKKLFDEAGQKMTDLEGLIKKGLVELAQKSPTGGATKVSPQFAQLWERAKTAWKDANDSVNEQLEKLRSSLLKENDPELKRIAEFGLNAMTAGHRVPLQKSIVEMDEALGKNNVSQKIVDDLKTRTVDFRDHIETDDQIEECDDNPFEVKVSIRNTLGPALNQMEQALDKAFAA